MLNLDNKMFTIVTNKDCLILYFFTAADEYARGYYL